VLLAVLANPVRERDRAVFLVNPRLAQVGYFGLALSGEDEELHDISVRVALLFG